MKDKYEIENEYSELFNKHLFSSPESEQAKEWRKSQLHNFDSSRYQDIPETHGSISWLPTFFLIIALITLVTYVLCQTLP